MLHNVRLAIDLCLLALLAYIVWTIYSQYQKEAGTNVWQRLIAACRDSATILVAKLMAIAGALVDQVDDLAGLIGGPEAQQFVTQWFNPKVAAALLLACAFLVFKARTRLGSSNPPSPPSGS